MNDANRESVLRRKLAPRVAAPAFDFAAVDDAPDPGGKALARAFVRAANSAAGLVARGRSRARRGGTLAELLDMVDPLGFVGLLANGDGPPGLVAMDPAGSAALIEAMTIGALSAQPVPARRLTRTDAALLGDVVDAVLAEIDANPDPGDDLPPGYRFSRRVEDLRLLDVMLDDVDYELGVLGYDLLGESVVRAGDFVVAVPSPAPAFAGFVLPPAEIELPEAPDTHWQDALETAVLSAPADLGAVLGRVRMRLAEVMALGVGSQLTLPLSQLEEVQLESLDRRPLGLGRLGQFRGQRALRLTSVATGGPDPCPDFESAAAPGETMAPEDALSLQVR